MAVESMQSEHTKCNTATLQHCNNYNSKILKINGLDVAADRKMMIIEQCGNNASE